jgi:hypothetical protein
MQDTGCDTRYMVRGARCEVRGAGYRMRYKMQGTRCKIQYKVLVHYASYDSTTPGHYKLVGLAARARPYAARPGIWRLDDDDILAERV